MQLTPREEEKTFGACLGLGAFRTLTHGLSVTLRHPLIDPATPGADLVVCVGGPGEPGGAGGRRPSPHGRATLCRDSPRRGPGL